MVRYIYERIMRIMEIKPVRDTRFLEFQADQAELENQPLPFLMRATLYFVIIIVLTSIIWACVAKVDRVVVALGKTISTAQTVTVQPLEAAVIKKFEVEVGEIVKEGQVLVRLDPTFSQANEKSLAARKDALALQIARLDAELRHEEYAPDRTHEPAIRENQVILFKGRRSEYMHRISAYDQHLEELSSSLASSEQQKIENLKQLQILTELENIYGELYKRKVQSRADFLNAQFQKYSKQADVSRLSSEISEKSQSIARITSEKNAFLSKWHNDISTELATVRKEYDGVAEELTKAERMHSLSVLTAPRPGVVLQFGAYSEGSVVIAGEPIMTLVPLDAPLEAEIYIDPKEIGYVQIGDTCRLKLDTFPFQKHGVISGTLRTISDDSIKIDGHDTPLYKGRVSLTNMALSGVPEGFHFLPGISLRGEIKVGTRRVISFFAYPLIRTLDESLREP